VSSSLAETTSLSPPQRRLLELFASRLRSEFGKAVHEVWLFGSRARGEPMEHEDSDVDVLVVVDDDSWDAKLQIRRTLDGLARGLGLEPEATLFSVHVVTPAWLEQRRSVASFFVAEIDRDKVIVEGPD
jgi:predicted nucleotidyltransferase